MKTSELTGPALDWAVAKCEGGQYEPPSIRESFWIWPTEPTTYSVKPPKYSTNWSQGGPIIEREELCLMPVDDDGQNVWAADRNLDLLYDQNFIGPSPLIAAMRCYVASKLGDEVEIPEELR